MPQRRTSKRRRTLRQKRRRYQTRKQRLQQRGGLIEAYQAVFDALFGDRWVLTGSEAVRLYLEYLGLTRFYTVKPQDVDILVVDREPIRSDRVFGFERQQDYPMRSMTFRNPATNQSFDVTVQQRPLGYYNINGVRLAIPKTMLMDYEDNMDSRSEAQQAANTVKIAALRDIVANISEIYIQPQRIDLIRQAHAAAPVALRPPQGMRLFGNNDD